MGERYDMALCSNKGQTVVAFPCTFFQRAADHGILLFVLADCDPSGYSIRRVIGEPTKTMPEHRVNVISLGLTVEQAVRSGKTPEVLTRSRELDGWMYEGHRLMTLVALEWVRSRLRRTAVQQ